jgi:hypothetical protein
MDENGKIICTKCIDHATLLIVLVIVNAILIHLENMGIVINVMINKREI